MISKRSFFLSLSSLLLLSACPGSLPTIDGKPNEWNSEQKLEDPYENLPKPESSPSPATASTQATQTRPVLAPFRWFTLENGDIISDSFKLNFGPGSKGFEFAPGSKGFDFGPGSKGFNALNLRFDIRYPETLTNPNLPPFKVQQSALEAFGGPKIQELVIEFIRDNTVYATATTIPLRPIIQVPASFAPGEYQLSVLLKTPTHTQQLSWQEITVSSTAQTVLRVDVYGDTQTRPEDLDVGVLTKIEPFPIASIAP